MRLCETLDRLLRQVGRRVGSSRFDSQETGRLTKALSFHAQPQVEGWVGRSCRAKRPPKAPKSKENVAGMHPESVASLDVNLTVMGHDLLCGGIQLRLQTIVRI